MSTITTKDGTTLFYKDSGEGQPIVFSHGWPLSADAWDAHALFFHQNGFRAIAHDRRGHGRSAQTWENNSMDQFADDLAALIDQLELEDVTLVGHSTGGGEVTRYVGRHGTSRLARVVLLGAIPPLMLKTNANPGGLPLEVFDGLRKGIAENRSQFYLDLTNAFYGFNRKGAKVSEGTRLSFWRQSMMGGLKSHYDSIKEFSESDFTSDLKKFDIPTLIIHGDDDQIVPIGASAMLSSKLVPDAELKVYPGGQHGLAELQMSQFNSDVLDFITRTSTTTVKGQMRPERRGTQPEQVRH